MFADDCPLKEELPDGTVFEYWAATASGTAPRPSRGATSPTAIRWTSHELSSDGVLMVQEEEPWTHIVKVGRAALQDRVDQRQEQPHQQRRLAGRDGGVVAVPRLAQRTTVLPVAQRNTGLLPNAHYVSGPIRRWTTHACTGESATSCSTTMRPTRRRSSSGYPNESGWMAYVNNGCCFVKTFEHERGARYPDAGCSSEAYSAGWGIDIESLSPLQLVKPGETISHEEEWFVFDCPTRPAIDDDEIAGVLAPFARRAGFELPVAYAASSGIPPARRKTSSRSQADLLPSERSYRFAEGQCALRARFRAVSRALGVAPAAARSGWEQGRKGGAT